PRRGRSPSRRGATSTSSPRSRPRAPRSRAGGGRSDGLRRGCGRGTRPSAPSALQGEPRIFEAFLERVGEGRNGSAGDRAGVGRGREGEDGAHRETTVDRDDALFGRADGNDRCLKWVEDRGETLHREHAEVGDREDAALKILGAELILPRAADEVGTDPRDL